MTRKAKPESSTQPELPANTIYLNRELSQLAFNRRVLAQAEDDSVPLLERLRYLCICSSNLDEFFEVRIASLLANRIEGEHTDPPELRAALERTSAECHRIVARQYELLNEEILPQLAANGIHLLRHDDRNDAQRAWVKQYFEQHVRPLLTPIGLDPAHPFPQVHNKSLNFIIELSGKDAFGRGTGIVIIKAPRVLPRVIKLPDHLSAKGQSSFCLLSSVIHAHIADLFPGRDIMAYSQFRVTRNSDLWVDEEEVKNLRQALETELQSRQFGVAVRLEVAANCPEHLSQFLLNQFNIEHNRLYAVQGPVNMVRLGEIVNLVNQPELRFPPFSPTLPPQLASENIFDALDKKDVLLHHPFQSFQPVVDFIRTAAHDPRVLAIKQTIYRTGMNSDLMEALIYAAQHGKEVTVIVELMARFDEEANINWAVKLEQAGAQVVYGVVGLKTHAKLALVIRRDEDQGLRFYAHLGTGNYHPNTTKFYTDFGLLTSNQELTAEVNEVFIHLTSLTKPRNLTHLWLAPFSLQKEIIRAIRNEGQIAREGRPARIIAKMNALLDESVIRALYAASADGVKIDLIVRGACALRPGVPGLSDNIKVRSIIGRYLEHSRIYYFRNDLAHDVYLASADWMNRNLFRRIEVAFPVLDKALKKRVISEGLNPYLKDNTNSWLLDVNGVYTLKKPRNKQQCFNAQQHLMSTLGIPVAPSEE
ncbi:polyphosphate kinase [Herbaspirillum rubrisubalbicans]|jgi:polyphosphate kinase|uniref:Polyphosphate kinase n=2 Tax=Herbaspirillum rubrisubalbicans TaxID=80842 RepID=A0ABX9BW40_9BURK|nr:polyphosphate kinase 1 [Herbaspirillum rubrisubalbicans]MCP1576584.1 polyphosphate kinase [Herbaspirillum rubrisubalbicans]NQE51658.1 polyphosphate kinase [Herbaspirillum rubrisubalbicans]QJP99809.1 polyphosphate kinase 1 [Herbaspirillum rubrisubalbicans Os34]RAM61922.1 polyphosphate kinase [Herbaspirillum rubrisubalbicans]RAN43042.1 polyphosphate kinase [Herbaspirillum rubrisubalbicans]